MLLTWKLRSANGVASMHSQETACASFEVSAAQQSAERECVQADTLRIPKPKAGFYYFVEPHTRKQANAKCTELAKRFSPSDFAGQAAHSK